MTDAYINFSAVQSRHLKEQYPEFNTMSCEQTFAWLSRYKKILAAMSEVHT